MSERLLKIEEVMDRLSLTRHQVYRRIQSGRLPGVLDREGKLHYVVREADLLRYEAASSNDGDTDADSPAAMLRIPDVARLLGFTPETIRRMCERGELSYVRGIGARGHYRISRAAVDEYQARNGHSAPSA